MRFQITIFAAISALAIFSNSCGGAANPNNQTITTNKTANATVSGNSNNPLATTKAAEESTTNNAPTLAPVVAAYYDALKKKDETGAHKYLSQSAVKYWQDEMKSEKAASLLAILEDNESPVDEKREVRNEKIDGETATAELKGGSLGVWTKTKFVKENGEWKFASPKESFLSLQDIPRTDQNSNAAK